MENMSFVTLLAVLVSVLMNDFVNGQDNQACKCFFFLFLNPSLHPFDYLTVSKFDCITIFLPFNSFNSLNELMH